MLNWLFRHYSRPVNCIKIGGHVALLSDPTVNCLYCGGNDGDGKTNGGGSAIHTSNCSMYCVMFFIKFFAVFSI